jgi:hypothetical protein
VIASHAAGFTVHRPPPPPPRPVGTAAAATAFLDAWQRSLTTAWAVDERVERVTARGGRLVYDVHEARRPPDSLEWGLGAVSARKGDELLACATGTDGRLGCRQQPNAPSYAGEVAQRMTTLRQLVVGPTALYGVAQIGGCFQLLLRLPGFPVPPYGKRALFCFDPATGAPAGTVIERDEAVDRTTVVSAHSPPTDDDLALPAAGAITAGAPHP